MALDQTFTAGAEITIHADKPKSISPDLFGIFFEDINYAADGGLYAELIQNRSFEYSSADHPDWNFFTGWELIPNANHSSIALGTDTPIHPNNPHYLVLTTDNVVGLRNGGFDGIVLKANESYTVSVFARTLSGTIGALSVRLENHAGETLGAADLPSPTGTWTKYTATITPTVDERHARFVLFINGAGSIALDMLSLFPHKTFHNRPNGLRADLAQAIADLGSKFIRFPGGCLVHGDGLDNMYRWKDTLGPLETRREQPNIWNYHQSVGLGYFEYFQFCEDIGAKPVPVIPAGVCCPNTGAKFNGLWEQGQQGLPMDAMPDYVQEILDLIEWANGPITSTWGAKRAEAGHPAPFGLEYLAIGNEDRITSVFKERFKMIYAAVKANYPDIILIGTVGPRPEGEDYDEGWQLAHEMKMDMVDEHGYRTPEWFWDNLQRYDSYDRDASAVYLGEYAAHDIGRRSTLRSALAEAAYMTALERNGDIVRLSSYAPLLGKRGRLQWEPDLIYFDNAAIYPTINYYAQQLFCQNSADLYLPIAIKTDNEQVLAVSCVQDSTSGDIILKLVSRADEPVRAQIDLAGVADIDTTATCTVLTGDPLNENVYSFWRTQITTPTTAQIEVASQFTYELPAHSLSVIRLKRRNDV